MARRSFRARVGTGRITNSLRPSEAGYTESIRKQVVSLETAISSVINELKDVTPDVIREALQPTFDKSQKYVPVDTSDLKKSGYLVVRASANKIKAEMGYGKAGDPHYAVYVHEMMDIAHKAPTRAKYLQGAIEEDIGDIPGRILRGYKARIPM